MIREEVPSVRRKYCVRIVLQLSTGGERPEENVLNHQSGERKIL